MIAHKNQRPPTKAEQERISRMLELGCILTWLKFGVKRKAECHHIVSGNKRLGHLYTIPLSPWYHRKVTGGRSEADMLTEFGASLAHGRKRFIREHGYTEMDLWLRVQHALGLSDELPITKILPRRVA